MAAPVIHPAGEYYIYINEVKYTGINQKSVKVTTKLNQIAIADFTLQALYSELVSDSGTTLTLDRLNNFPTFGKVRIDSEVIRYTSRTIFDAITSLEAQKALYDADPGGYTEPAPQAFTLTGLMRGYEGTVEVTHPAGSRVYIYPEPAEGLEVVIYQVGREDPIFIGVISYLTKNESDDSKRVECIGIEQKIRDIQVETVTTYTDTLTGTLIAALKPPGADWEMDVDVGVRMNYRRESGNWLMHLTNLSLISGLDWWITIDATRVVKTIHCRANRGLSHAVTASYTVKQTALNLFRMRAKEKIFNSIVALGSSEEMQGSSTSINANTTRITTLLTTESYLTANVIVADTTIYVQSSTDYEVGTLIQIGDEKLLIGSKSTGTLVVTRAQEGTTAAVHYVNDPVLMLDSLTIASSTEFTSQGSVMIGSEKILMGTATGGQLVDLTRGADGTQAYAHRAGTLVLSGDFTNATPENDATGPISHISSIALYGVRGMRQSVIGAADLDGLDKFAGAVLMQTKDLLENGSFQVPLSSFSTTLELGDSFTLVEYDTPGSVIHRLTGLIYEDDLVTLEYGLPEEWILADFADNAKAMQLATQKSAPAAQGPILAMSDDKKLVQVQGPDGPVWVRVGL